MGLNIHYGLHLGLLLGLLLGLRIVICPHILINLLLLILLVQGVAIWLEKLAVALQPFEVHLLALNCWCCLLRLAVHLEQLYIGVYACSVMIDYDEALRIQILLRESRMPEVLIKRENRKLFSRDPCLLSSNLKFYVSQPLTLLIIKLVKRRTQSA